MTRKRLARTIEFVDLDEPDVEILPGQPLLVYSAEVETDTEGDVDTLIEDLAAVEADITTLEAKRDYFTLDFHVPGALSANIFYTWQAPFACTFVEISAVASNNSDATLKVGTAADDDFTLVAAAIGDSGTPVVFNTWAAANPTGAVADNAVVVFTLDYDGPAGTAAQNVTVVATMKKTPTT